MNCRHGHSPAAHPRCFSAAGKPRSPAIVQPWKRVVAVGCTHGDLAAAPRQAEVLAFCERFKPTYRFELGDIVDTAAMRGGARGTADESKSLITDCKAALDWLERYRPTHLSWGNHDARLDELAKSPNAVIAYAAQKLQEELNAKLRNLGTVCKPYDFEKNWHQLGGTYWGHGFWYGEHAVRDHAEYLGGPVVMAHLHKPMQVPGRTRQFSQSYCVGTLADIPQLTYARRRRATGAWGHGIVFGEVSVTKSQLWLTSSGPGDELRFPC